MKISRNIAGFFTVNSCGDTECIRAWLDFRIIGKHKEVVSIEKRAAKKPPLVKLHNRTIASLRLGNTGGNPTIGPKCQRIAMQVSLKKTDCPRSARW